MNILVFELVALVRIKDAGWVVEQSNCDCLLISMNNSVLRYCCNIRSFANNIVPLHTGFLKFVMFLGHSLEISVATLDN